MLRKVLIIILFLLAASIGFIVVQDNINESEDNSGQNNPGEGQEENIGPIEKQLKGMSLEEKIGQMVIVGVEGLKLDHNSQEMIEKYHVGGFIFFKRNIEDVAQGQKLINALKKSNEQENNIPLFLSIDEEGGKVTRMPKEFQRLPTNERIGLVNDMDLSYQMGQLIGKELNIIGLNMDFAPVLDINSNPANPVIGDRAFGGDPALVSKLGLATMEGLRKENIIPVVKHFPGHGDTTVDSHIGLPKVNHGLERLEDFELGPFKDAIKKDADGIMIAHLLLPQIDQQNPATLSKTIITEILRKKLNYKGVVITDDMTMGAIAENYEIGEAAIKSVKAGSDIVLVCHEYDNQVRVIEALKTAAQKGDIPIERIDESVYRILLLKEKYNFSNGTVEADTKENLLKKIQGINSRISEIIEIANKSASNSYK